jgi:hypothetical protein
MVQGYIPGRGKRFFSSAKTWGPASLLFTRYRGAKQPVCEAHHSHLSSAKIKNVWKYISFAPAFMACTVTIYHYFTTNEIKVDSSMFAQEINHKSLNCIHVTEHLLYSIRTAIFTIYSTQMHSALKLSSNTTHLNSNYECRDFVYKKVVQRAFKSSSGLSLILTT